MNRYLATITGHSEAGEKKQLIANLNYEENRLVGWELTGDITKPSYDYFLGILPVDEQVMLTRFKGKSHIDLQVIPENLTFERFWLEFDNKLSHKNRSEKIWMSMTDNEKTKALKYIHQYNQYLILNPGVTKKHADTYLRQKPWNN